MDGPASNGHILVHQFLSAGLLGCEMVTREGGRIFFYGDNITTETAYFPQESKIKIIYFFCFEEKWRERMEKACQVKLRITMR
jgi:hypothetical protein